MPLTKQVNRLLSALPKKEFQRILPDLKEVKLDFGDILCEPGDIVSHVYFPTNSVISLLSAVAEHSTLEVGMVGNEGLAGISVFMGVKRATTRSLVQGGGIAMQMKSTALRRASGHTGPFNTLLLRYSHSLLTQISQSSACNRFHPVNARLARWLLMTADRAGSNQFRLTQDFMSHMLGVRREGVNKAAGALQKAKLIKYSRGMITILDRAGVEAACCGCYQLIKRESDNSLN